MQFLIFTDFPPSIQPHPNSIPYLQIYSLLALLQFFLFIPLMIEKKPSIILKQSALSILSKSPKSYLPSRYQLSPHHPKSPKLLFSHLQQLFKTTITSKFRKTVLPKIEKENRCQKKCVKDLEQFRSIFVKPKEELLGVIGRVGEGLGEMEEGGVISKGEMGEYVNKAINLSTSPQSTKTRSIYQEQIKVEPPTLPNSSIASPLTPGNGYAPSIPPIQLLKQTKTTLKDLLLRCQNGSNIQDIEKQSHLSFFLGLAYQKSEQYDLAIKFFQRFMKYARMMEDRIGLALGANRIGCNEYYVGNYQRSILFHEENIRLSDSDNVFAGMYNLGIINRRVGKEEKAIQFFESALQWARERGVAEETCLIYGQIGTTYLGMGKEEEAYWGFKKALEVSKGGNKRLHLDSLLMILKLSMRRREVELVGREQQNVGERMANHEELLESALKIAEELNLFDIVECCLCNLGTIEMKKQLDVREQVDINEIEIIS